MTTEHESLISRINKLLALANDPNANVHEAASAAASVHELMTQHHLSSADLVGGPAPVGKFEINGDGARRAVLWQASLAHMLGKHLHVFVAYTSGTDTLTAYGREPDVAALAALFHHLKGYLERACDRGWDGIGRTGRASSNGGKPRFTVTFMLHASKAIDERMAARRAETVAALPAASAGTALVRLDTYASETKAAIVAYRARLGIQTRSSTRRIAVSGSAAAAMGAAAGRAASLNPGSRALPGRR